jgi:ribA/ribD-fused uncharacterized protein
MDRATRLIEDGYADIEPVLFYAADDTNGEGSNFSQHGLWLPDPHTGKMRWYKTGEHRFQAMKGQNAQEHAEIADQPTAYKAKEAGGPRSKICDGVGFILRPGWGNDYGDLCWYAMFETVLAKTLQNDDVFAWLMSTHSRPIYEDSPTDDIWGWRFRNDYRGKNLLGRCWMSVRAVLGLER